MRQRRRFNDDRLRVFGGGHRRVIGFICECSDPGCSKTVPLTEEEYAARRREGLILHESHELESFDDGSLPLH